ncbi:MAG: PAS domain S-box protein [Myxococcaceae bacterium]|nr:PAS domain S-box protein [Myxococcaceae bacterium]
MSHASPGLPGGSKPSEPAGVLGIFRSWLLGRLDALLSEHLRNVPPSELSRARVLVGAACALFLFDVLYLLLLQLPTPDWIWRAPAAIGGLGYLGTLVLMRRGSSTTAPAFLLCLSTIVAIVSTIFLYRNAHITTHAVIMLAPAFAVYLLGPRKGFLVALLTILLLGIAPLVLSLYFEFHAPPPTREFLWMIHVASSLAILSIWLVGALNSTARDEAQAALEETMRELRDSERKLSSLFENTDDMVCSLDTEGRLLIANTALRQAFLKRFGQEPTVGQPLFTGVEPSDRARWEERFRQVLQGQRLSFEVDYSLGDRRVVLEASMGPILGEQGQPTGMVLFARDVSARKEAEARLGEMHRTLVDISRQAGMAEIATGVLHNVGNTLNSVNVSASLVADGLRKLRVSGVGRAAALFEEHSADMASFITRDPRGQQLPAYLKALAQGLKGEQEVLLQEADALLSGIEHIKSIVNMQQEHARPVGAEEEVSVPQLIDEALRLHAISFERVNIIIERDYGEVPRIMLDRHKLLQILLNLMMNARHALVSSDQQEKRLRIRVRRSSDGGKLLIEVADNGMGIAPEHLPRLFTQGFTTKKDGHGFGLHISALAATEMKGRLTCSSPGGGQGATFTLELPLADK